MSRKPPPRINHPYVFSVSQAQTFRLCPRKWAYIKIDGIEDPGNESSKLGGEVHEEIEEYLENSVPIAANSKAGKIAMSGLPFLPPPMYPGMSVEAWFHVKVGDAYYRGLKDVEIEKGWKRPGVPFVSDHKTTKNFMWAKTSKDLTGGDSDVGDVQAGLYAYDTMVKTGAAEVDLQWTYMCTTGAPKGEPTIATISRDQVDRIIHELELTTAEMILTKDEHPTASTVDQDPTGCAAFGGCPFKDLCNLTPQEKMKAMMAQSKKESGVLGKLAARKAAKQQKAASGGDAKKEKTNLKVVKTEAENAKVNPPENADAPVVTADDVEKKPKRTAKTKAKATSSAGQAPQPIVAGGSVLGRAVDAFWGVIVDDLASRISEKLKK